MFDPGRRHLIAYLAAAAVLVVMVARVASRDSGSGPAPSISMAAPASAQPARPRAAPPPQALIWVDVAGAVQRPGLYSLPKGARISAALERAGGIRGRADRAAVNLAAKLVDGQQVFVPARGGRASAAVPMPTSTGASAGSAAGVGSANGAGAASAPSGAAWAPVSLSSASQAQLEELDGIGPALAQRIVEYRNQHGGFRSVEELQEVSGIGAKRFEALKGSVAP